MSEPQPVYYADIVLTKAELNLIARGRRIKGFAVVDFDSMTIYPCRDPEYCNGKHSHTLEELIVQVRSP